MADFQSSLTAPQIETVLTDAIVPTRGKALTEVEKLQAREYIGATALGEGIKIISHFDTLEELEAAVSNPKAGDAYSVGTEIPYSLYIFDFYHNEWKNYGAIRSDDITARLAQNITVLPGAWEEDTDVFPDYTFKAAIPLGEITGNDFSIVAFNPSDAAGGNFCPIAYAFDGYVEIWATRKPDTEIIIPAVTFIALNASGGTGNSTKGITNATGVAKVGENSLLDGSITAAKVKSEARTQYFNVAVGAEWVGDAAPYSQTIAVEGLLETDRAVVRFSAPTSFENLDAQQEAFALLYTAESAGGAITLYAKEKPETAFSVVLEVARI